MKQMKRFFSLLLALALVLTCAPQLPLRAEAATVASGSCGTNVTWMLDDAGTLTINGTGAMKDYNASDSVPWYSRRASVKKVVIKNDVTTIGKYAFYNCTSLTSVEIPDSVTTIGEWAFDGCYSLTSVEIPASVTTISDEFDYCTSLTRFQVDPDNPNYSSEDGVLFNKDQTILIRFPVGKDGAYTIPASVTTIGSYAFSDCRKLASVEILDSVTTIASGAFFNCTSLASVEIPASVTTIGASAFGNCELTEIFFMGSAPTIRGYGEAFDYVTATAYYYPDESWTEEVMQSYGGTITWVAIDKVASGNCGAEGDNVKWELYDDGLLRIFGTGAMKEYTISSDAPWYSQGVSVKKVIIEDGVTTIGGYAFYCRGLISVEIPDSVTTIGDSAFYSCTSLTNVEIPDSVTTIGSSAFSGCASLTSVEIPDSVTTIGSGAFYSCNKLTSVEIGDSVITIGDGAFRWCNSLTKIQVDPNNPNYSSEDGVLFNKTKTTLIQFPGDKGGAYTIPSSVTTIGDYAFYSCHNLTSVKMGDSVTTIGEYAFYWCTRLTEICFEGSAPAIGYDAFGGDYVWVQATAYYYPDETWTSDVMQNYGGTITWVALEKAQVVASGECGKNGDNVKWELYDDGLLRIFGTGAMKDYGYPDYAPWYSRRANVKKAVIENDVTTIGGYAFYYCTSLTSVEMGDSVTTIGYFAFTYCDSLTSVEIGNSVTTIGSNAFAYCDGLTSVKMGDSVTTIGYCAFRNCDSLTSVEMGDSVTKIGDSAIYDCDSLTSVEIPNSVTTIGVEAFYSCDSLTSVEIGDSVTTIGNYAFCRCTGLTSVKMGDSVTTIGSGAFYSCNKLTSVEIGDSVTTIGREAFYCCTSLTSVEIPDSVTTIGEGAFAYCDSLTSVEMGDSVTSIGKSAFSSCDSLTSVEIPASVTSIGDSAFSRCTSLIGIQVDPNNPNYSSEDGVLFNKDKTTLVCFPGGKGGAYTVPDSVTTIGDYSFQGCDSLTSVYIPASVTSIGDYAFDNCDSLTSVEIPASVTTIGSNAFYSCDSLTSVEIGDSDTTIGASTFKSCASLKEVWFEGSAPTIGTDVFYGVTATAYYYPDETWTSDKLQNYGGTITWVALERNIVASGECGAEGDNVKWELYDDGLLRISGTGAMANYSDSSSDSAPWYSRRTSVKKAVIKNGVTTIGGYAFYYCHSLTSVEIPNSVTVIHKGAFFDCDSLTSVYIPASVYSIGSLVFSYCTRLSEIQVNPNSFQYCSEDGVLFFKDKTTLVIFPSGKRGTYAIPDSVTAIGRYAFWGCAIERVEIPESITAIGKDAFSCCYGLKSVEIPDSVTTIGSGAFSNCDSLTSVEIPASVTTIGSQAFLGCTSLSGFRVDPNNPDYSSNEDGVLFNKDQTTLVCFPGGKDGAYTVPDSVTTIGDYAFYYCDALTSVEIPASVTTIGWYAFAYCTSLTEIYFEGSAPTIHSTAFSSVTATAYYYPDETWTSDKLQNYGGTITWVAREKEAEVELSVGTEEVEIGETFTVEAVLTNSSDIRIGTVLLDFDATALELIGGTCQVTGANPGAVLADEKAGTFFLTEEAAVSGTIFTFQFKVKDGAALGEYTIGGEAAIGLENGQAIELVATKVTVVCEHDYETQVFPVQPGQEGYTLHVCGKCGHSYEEGRTDILASGNCGAEGDNVKWKLDIHGTLTIYGTGAMKDYSSASNVPWFSQHANVKKVIIESGVTTIGDYAFAYCDSLTSVEIPDSITTIGSYAFYSCDGLTSVEMGDSVTTIGDLAFCGCISLTSVEIPDSVTTIGNRAFASCASLIGIQVDPNNPNYSSEDGVLFDGSKTTLIQFPGGKGGAYTVPASVTTIGSYAFYECTSLTSVEIPDSVTTIGDYAFCRCASLASVEIPASVTTIGKYAFSYCDSLTSVEMGDSVTTIGDSAFYSCENLTSVEMGDSVTTIGDLAFCGCIRLTSVEMGDSVTSIGKSAFSSCDSLTEIYFMGSAPTIGSYAFYDVTATAYYYPDESWTSDKLQDYGGDITWVARKQNVASLVLQTSASEVMQGNMFTVEAILTNTDPIKMGTVALVFDDALFELVDGTCHVAGANPAMVVPSAKAGTFLLAQADAVSGKVFTFRLKVKDGAALGKQSLDVKAAIGMTTGTYIDATGVEITVVCDHEYTAVVTPASCTTGGYTTYTCACGHSYISDYTEPSQHDFRHFETVEATCTQEGYVRYSCALCGQKKDTVLPAVGHNYGDDDVCDSCGHSVAPGHTHSYTTVVTAPTCTATGYTTYTCACGHSYRANMIEATGHSWSEGTVSKPATCLAEGVMRYTCACGAEKTEVIPAGHDWSETLIKAATCTADGSAQRVCRVCGETETEILPAGHKWNEGTVTKEATCTASGSKDVVCTACGETETQEIPVLGHHFYNGVCTRCGIDIGGVITPNPEHPLNGLFFQIDDIISGYGSETINQYGAYMDVNPEAKIERIAVYVTQEGNLWRRTIACVGSDITYATFVPYLAKDGEVKYSGLTSGSINNFPMTKNADGIWTYSNYATVGANLEDAQGKLLLSLYDIGQAGKNTRIFTDLEEMKDWLENGDVLYGDVTGDKKIDGRDVLMLCKYLVNYDYDTGTSTVTITEGSDATGDGKIDGRDALMLCKYLVNYDYDTGTSSVVLGPKK